MPFVFSTEEKQERKYFRSMKTLKHALNLTYKVFHIKYLVTKMIDRLHLLEYLLLLQLRKECHIRLM